MSLSAALAELQAEFSQCEQQMQSFCALFKQPMTIQVRVLRPPRSIRPVKPMAIASSAQTSMPNNIYGTREIFGIY